MPALLPPDMAGRGQPQKYINLRKKKPTNTYTRRKRSPLRYTFLRSKGKGKAIPLHAWMGPESSRRLRLPDFKTIGK